jgi:hypothetical protein
MAAYGGRALPFLVHLPLEWWAFAYPTATLAATTPHRIRRTVLLLAFAALAESYLTPQR